MDTLTESQEQRLEKALSDAVVAYNAGATPNDAIVKVASQYGLEPNFVERVVNVFNSAIAISNFRKAASAEDRKREFPLADVDVILRRMYPDRETIIEEMRPKQSSYLPSDYLRTETTDFNAMPKVAAELPKAKVEKYASKLDLGRKTFACRDMLKQAVDNARVNMTACQQTFFAGLAKAANYFRQYGHKPFAEVETAVRSNVDTDSTKILFDMIYEHGKCASFNEKRGSVKPTMIVYDPDEEPYKTIETLLEDGVKLASAKAKVIAAESEYEQFEKSANAKLKAISAELGGVPKYAAEDHKPQQSYAKRLYQAFVDHAFGTKDDTPLDRRVEKELINVINPDIRAEAAASDAELMLHDFMLNDDVISGFEPYQVAYAFNEISRLAPRVIQQPVIMRELLRRRLQQGTLGAMESGQAANIEETMMKLEDPPKLPTAVNLGLSLDKQTSP